MKQIISASRRTDLPAFSLDWLIDQLQQVFGYIPLVGIADRIAPDRAARDRCDRGGL